MFLVPSQKPRLTLTLDPEIAFLLRRLSALTGDSQAALVSELLEANRLGFFRLIRSLEHVARERYELVNRFAADLDASQDLLESQLNEAQLNLYLSEEAEREASTLPLRLEPSVKRRKGRIAPVDGAEAGDTGTRRGHGVASRSPVKAVAVSVTRSKTPTH